MQQLTMLGVLKASHRTTYFFKDEDGNKTWATIPVNLSLSIPGGPTDRHNYNPMTWEQFNSLLGNCLGDDE